MFKGWNWHYGPIMPGGRVSDSVAGLREQQVSGGGGLVAGEGSF